MPRLFLKQGVGQGFYYDVGPGTTTIGRSRGCTIELRALGVSRAHASIRLEADGTAVLEDTGSKNGTFVNGERIEKTCLAAGDEIRIGNTIFVYREGEEKEGSITLPRLASPMKSTVRSILAMDAVGGFESAGAAGDPEGLRKSHRYLAVVCKAGRTVAATLNLSEILNAVMDIVFDVVSPDEAFVMLKDDATGELKLRLFRSKTSPGREAAIAVSRTILNRACKEGVAVLSADASADSRFKASKSVARYHMMSTMCVPLISKGEVLGVLHAANRVSSGEFSDADLQLLSGIANQAALAIENAKLYDSIKLEVRRRNNLQRYLPPNAVELIMDGKEELNLGGEIKEVTVLFSDIREFTRLSEELPPSEVVGMLNEYFSEMTRVVFKYEGTIDKFVGDALIAIFGAAFSRPDDPRRAVRAAIEMQLAMKELNARWRAKGRKTFRIGIGVDTGEVLYGNVGSEQRMELTVIGDAVNLAARLAGAARGGETLVSGPAWLKLDEPIEAEEASPLEIRGKAEPVEVHRIKTNGK